MAKKKVVIIGFGGHARSWLHSIKGHPDFELVGIIDVDTEMLENIGQLGPDLKNVATDTAIEDYVKFNEKPDLAIIATPIFTHHSLVREVLKLGINVICEKNLASTLQQGRQMVQAALDHPELCTATGFQNRFNPGFWSAKQYLAQEEPSIGELGFIKWQDFGYRGESRWGWRRHLAEIYPEDQCPHWFDVIRWITGMDIVQVKADTFMPRYSEWHGASTICANLALAKPGEYRHRHNWVWAQLFGDWQLGGPPHSSFEFFGKKGQFSVAGLGLDIKVYPDMSNRTKFEEDGYLPVDAGPIRGTKYTGQQVILEQMSRGIDSKGKIQPDTNFVEAYKSFAVSMCAIESSHAGKAVWVPDTWADFKGVDIYYKE
ncbi:MAG: Gfo/Idh/MocA family oxidoreductase [Candidatus Lokiarchaeota archaeon]|nr:Gfo/Idh/MocA family oxidoreductase [Candidatus Lokiarchaeota archaeon]